MKRLAKTILMAAVPSFMIGAFAGNAADGCASLVPKEKSDEVLISVNGKVLTRSGLDADVEKVVAAQGDKIPAEQKDYMRQSVRNQLAQSFLVQNALVAKARSRGYVVTAEDRQTREKELLEALAKRTNGPKSMAEYAAQYPLGKERAMEDFENGILIDKLIRAETAKSRTKLNASEVGAQVIKEVLRTSGARVADEFRQLLAKDEADQNNNH